MLCCLVSTVIKVILACETNRIKSDRPVMVMLNADVYTDNTSKSMLSKVFSNTTTGLKLELSQGCV